MLETVCRTLGLLDVSVFALHTPPRGKCSAYPLTRKAFRHIITVSSLLDSWFGCLFGCFADSEDLWGIPCFPHIVRFTGHTQSTTSLFARSLLTLGPKPQLFLAQPNGKFNSQLISPEFGAHRQVTGLPLSQERGAPHPQMANI